MRIPGLKKATKQELPRNHAQTHMQLDLRISHVFFQSSTVFFPPFFKYHVVSQVQSEDYIGEDDIIDMTEVIEV